MPYRLDVDDSSSETFDRLVESGALDIEDGAAGIAAILPDDVDAAAVADALAPHNVRVTPAVGRDDASVWLVGPRAVLIGGLRIVPADGGRHQGALQLLDTPAFGTGFHPTSALCLEAIEAEVNSSRPARLLDVGTGSGILALAALLAGVPDAVALDVDDEAVRAAVHNARLNGLSARLHVVQGGPDALSATFPLVVANVLAAPLVAMAPTLARRVARRGRLVLSGVRTSLAPEVEGCYTRLGMRPVRSEARHGWTALTLQAAW